MCMWSDPAGYIDIHVCHGLAFYGGVTAPSCACVHATLLCVAEAAALQAQQHAEAIALAEAQLQSTNGTVCELRAELSGLSADMRGQLAAKESKLEELHAGNTALTRQLADMETQRKQAENHAGRWGGKQCSAATGSLHRHCACVQ